MNQLYCVWKVEAVEARFQYWIVTGLSVAQANRVSHVGQATDLLGLHCCSCPDNEQMRRRPDCPDVVMDTVWGGGGG